MSTPTRIATARRLVIKVGSALVTNNGEGLDLAAIGEWARQIAALRKAGKEVVLVSSGAIACGMQRLGWNKRPHAVHELQAAAAVGQMGLAQVYESAFAGHGLCTAQILLTHDDLSDRKRYLNARATLTTLLAAETPPLAARKQWLADHLQLAGKLILDAGAIKALQEGKSLLPIGVIEAQGDFERGAAVACLSAEGREIARGLTNYGSSDARRIARHASQEIEDILGYIEEPEIIHRDNLMLV